MLGFPCNQFGKQEPGDDEQIANFCSLNFDVTFPMFAKIEVNGAKARPALRVPEGRAARAAGHRAIKWNFTKFLVDRPEAVAERFAPTTKPVDLESEIEKLL